MDDGGVAELPAAGNARRRHGARSRPCRTTRPPAQRPSAWLARRTGSTTPSASTFGYGLGAGLILNGELYGGAHGNAGEIGMILALVPGDGPDVEPLEHYASMAALCKLLDFDPSEPELFAMITDAILRGGPKLEQWMDSVAERLRRTVQILEIDLRSADDHSLRWRAKSADRSPCREDRAAAALDRRALPPLSGSKIAGRACRSVVRRARRRRRAHRADFRSKLFGDPQDGMRHRKACYSS